MITRVARLVLGLLRGDDYTDIREKVARLERLTQTLRETNTSWGSGRPPSQRKALAWFEQQAGLAGMTGQEGVACLFDTPECWPVVCANRRSPTIPVGGLED